MSMFTAPGVSAMIMSFDSVISATRTTTCDVMCTTNTPSVCKVPVENPSFHKEKSDATMPYKNYIAPKPTKGNTAFTLYRNIELKNGRSDDLKKEREVFFGKMEADRQKKMERETVAVTKIQAFSRGILVRPWPEETRKSKKPPVIRIGESSVVVQQLQDELCGYSVKLGLKPIHGLSLENRNKTNKRVKRIELAAALRLQSYFRMIKCIIKTKRKLNQARETMKQRASLVITKFFKWVLRVHAHDEMQNATRNMSIVKMQTTFRMFLAYHRVRKMLTERVYYWRTHDAQIIIRRNLYDKITKQAEERRKKEEFELKQQQQQQQEQEQEQEEQENNSQSKDENGEEKD